MGCSVENMLQQLQYIKLGETPDVEEHVVNSEASSVDVLFPFGTSIEPRIFVSLNKSNVKV
jgi:hypothetical protein